jgi:AcrR family transcriptional regulator
MFRGNSNRFQRKVATLACSIKVNNIWQFFEWRDTKWFSIKSLDGCVQLTEKQVKKRVSKAQWLEAAMDVLARQGINAVKVEHLARQLKVAKSGFYWHFQNRDDLLAEMLRYWEQEFNQVIMEDKALAELSSDQQLLAIMTMVDESRLFHFEAPVRRWAGEDPAAREVVKQIDARRLTLLENIFHGLGYRAEKLTVVSRLFHCYHAWESLMYEDDDPELHRRLIKLRHQFFVNSVECQ